MATVYAGMAGTEVETTSGLAVLARGVPHRMTRNPLIVVVRRKYARCDSRLRFPLISVCDCAGHVGGIVLAVLGAIAGAAPGKDGVQLTPVGIRVDNAPIPVKGADGRYHIVYELGLTNFSPNRVTVDRLDVLDGHHGGIVASLGAGEFAGRLVVPDPAAMPGSLGAAQTGRVYVHLVFEVGATVSPDARPSPLHGRRVIALLRDGSGHLIRL